MPVAVYVGSRDTAAALLITAGGQGRLLETLAGMFPEPDVKGPFHGSVLPHVPMASRGSVGIHPFSRPSLYDQAGDSTLPDMLELPIFHVQKNQFYKVLISKGWSEESARRDEPGEHPYWP